MSTDSDRAAIYEHREAYNSTLRAGDVEGWLATLTDDCVFLAHGTPAVQGKDAVRTWATESFFEPFVNDLDYDFEELEFVGDRAFAWGWFQQTLTPKDEGAEIQLRGKFLDVFRREENGSWRLARCSFTADHV